MDYQPIQPGIDCVVVADLAWAAGFWDGEGNANAYLKGERWQIQAAVTQIHLDTLERFRDIVGVGKIYGPYETASGVHPQWTLKIRGEDNIRHLYESMKPWLTPHKISQFEEVFARKESTRPVYFTDEERLERKRASGRRYAQRKREQRV